MEQMQELFQRRVWFRAALGLLVALIVVVIIAAVTLLGTNLSLEV